MVSSFNEYELIDGMLIFVVKSGESIMSKIKDLFC